MGGNVFVISLDVDTLHIHRHEIALRVRPASTHGVLWSMERVTVTRYLMGLPQPSRPTWDQGSQSYTHEIRRERHSA